MYSRPPILFVNMEIKIKIPVSPKMIRCAFSSFGNASLLSIEIK